MSKTKTITRLRKRLALANVTVCSYCGHKTDNSSSSYTQTLLEHLLSCPKRPELKLYNHIKLLEAVLVYCIEALKSGNIEEYKKCLEDVSAIIPLFITISKE